jgi:hypothetical protein
MPDSSGFFFINGGWRIKLVELDGVNYCSGASTFVRLKTAV